MASMAIGAGMSAAGSLISALNSGPSPQMEALNGNVQDFTNFMSAQAKTEGIDASSVFQKVMNPLSRILSGGPQQAGWSNAQVSNWNANATNAAAAKARDMGALGTGPSGPGQSAAQFLEAKQSAEDLRASGVAQGEQASATAGREEFNSAVEGAEKSTAAFTPANEAAAEMAPQEKLGMQSQQNIDTQKKAASLSGVAAKTLSAAGGAMMGKAGQPGTGSSPSGNPVGGIAGGEENLDTTGGSSMWEQAKNFGAGLIGKRTGGGTSGLPGIPPAGIGIGMGQSEE